MVRGLALLAFAGALLVLVTDWAVRHRRLQPFGWWPRAVRSAAGPVLFPLEQKLRRSGANPVDAPLWLVGMVLVVGLLTQGLVGWIAGAIGQISMMRTASTGAWVRYLLGGAIGFVMAALIVRVIGSWLALGRSTRWMRPIFLLTDWIVQPIARRLPSAGRLDLSPFLAYILLLLARSLIYGSSP